MTQRRITLLGATGSIGASTLKVLAHNPGEFALEAVTAMENVQKLAALAREHKPKFAVIGNDAHYAALKEALAGTGIEAAAGAEAVVEAALRPADTVVSAIVGVAGLRPTLAAVLRGARVALANKECLVAAGALMNEAAKQSGALLLPVDSEHNAIFQVFDREHPESITRVTLTASGGPFRMHTREQMQGVTPAQAVSHPNWSMGAKISVDSATMMNKGLELIEAYYLFPLSVTQLGVLVHPESIVHSLVEYADGSVLAQLSQPDMCTPIAHALAWPRRISAPVQRLSLARLGSLTFEEPDEVRFPALALARRALVEGPHATLALNAANEVAVAAFLAGRIGFLEIVEVAARALQLLPTFPTHTLEDVLAADAEARRLAEALLGELALAG